jgi:peroxiredoxin
MQVSRFPIVIASIIAIMLTAHAEAQSMAESTSSSRPVEQKLREMADKSSQKASPEFAEASRQGLLELVKSGIAESALNVGDTIPYFSPPDAHSKIVDSRDLLAGGPLILVFYRGAWCPYCNPYLASLQKYLPQFKSYGASLVTISGETPDRSLTVEEKDSLSFPVLSDTGLVASRKFGIVYEVPAAIRAAMEKRGFDLKKYYNSPKAELPLSATYVVDEHGTIVYAFLEPDYKLRAEPEDLLVALRNLTSTPEKK